MITFRKISDWKLKKVALLRQLDNGTVAQVSGDEGLLYVTLVAKQTGEERSGTVCDDASSHTNYMLKNELAIRLSCQNMGYYVRDGLWESYPVYKYVPEYVMSMDKFTLSTFEIVS